VAAAEPLGDALALKLQELRAQQRDPRPLLRIDNREQSAEAPFQFDTVNGRLHRRGCRAIPKGSQTALYGLWSVPSHARAAACTTCRPRIDGEPEPEPEEPAVAARDGVTDYVFGFLSVLDQFGSVIRERGREFRDSEEGRNLKAGFDDFYRGLEERERTTLQVVLTSLDSLLTTITELDRNLDPERRQNGHDGASRNGDGGHHP
jgi:hypothetical protein